MLGECAPSTWRHQLRQSFGEDRPRTPSVGTEEPANLDVQGDTSATPRKIIQRAVIAAVDALRTAKAQRTQRRAARCSQYESQARVCDEHALKSKATQSGQKRTKNSREMHRKLYRLPIQLHRN
jgi:hypothetical protein